MSRSHAVVTSVSDPHSRLEDKNRLLIGVTSRAHVERLR